MLLHVHRWGHAEAPPVVCLHGVNAHGRRFRRLAEDRLVPSFHVLAPDLRGHGRSGWDPPWNLERHVDDLRETLAALDIGRCPWVGHSLGGRLILELAAEAPELIERVVLLDPAIQILPHVALDFAERERAERVYDSIEEAIEERLASGDSIPVEPLEEEMREHLTLGWDGRLHFRYSQAAVVTLYGELARPAPPPQVLRVPTLLVHAERFGLVREDQLEEYRAALDGLLEVVPVPGGHIVYWEAWRETADAVARFLVPASGAAAAAQ